MVEVARRVEPEIGEPVIEARGIRRYFDVSPPFLNRLIEGGERRILRAVDDVSFDVARGETLALVGESGCGKSTVARCVVGLYPLTGGSIHFEGTDIATLSGAERRARFNRRVHMIFQDPYSSLNPRWRVRDIIAEPVLAYDLLTEPRAIRRRVDELLRFVGLSPADGEKFPHEFSGGQRQRISIARALAGESTMLVCDEPTSALDVSVQAQILNLMQDLQAEFGLTYLFISHDLAVISHVSDRVGVMYLGKIVEMADASDLFERPTHPYTRLLIGTVPKLDMSERDREPMSGEVPSPIDPPAGCHFHPRCPFANDRCRREAPTLTPRKGGGMVSCHAVAEGRITGDP
jgi:peptide/nickel transport system ATP-binding protein